MLQLGYHSLFWDSLENLTNLVGKIDAHKSPSTTMASEIREINDLVEGATRNTVQEAFQLFGLDTGYDELQVRDDVGGGAAPGGGGGAEGEASRGDGGDEAMGVRFLLMLWENLDTVGQIFLPFLFHDDVETLVLWVNDTHFLMCVGPNTDTDAGSLPYELEQMNAHGEFSLYVTYEGRDHRFVLNSASDLWDPDWPGVLLDLVSRCDAVSAIRGFFPVSAQELRAIVSRAPPGGRTIDVTYFRLASTARILAFGCHPNVTLVVHMNEWRDHVSILVEAMQENRSPRRLVLDGLTRADHTTTLVDAIRATAWVEELTVRFWSWIGANDCYNTMLAAIGESQSIRTLVVEQSNVSCSSVKTLWNSVLTSRTLESIDTAEMEADDRYTDAERRECAELVVSMLRSNPIVTQINYSRGTHDERVMEQQAVPLLRRNRFRRVVGAGRRSRPRARTVGVGAARVGHGSRTPRTSVPARGDLGERWRCARTVVKGTSRVQAMSPEALR